MRLVLLVLALAAALPAQGHPAGVRTVELIPGLAPCWGNLASAPSSPHVGTKGGVWLTMDREPRPGRPIGWRVENRFFFLIPGRWFVTLDTELSWPVRLPSPADQCFTMALAQAIYLPKRTRGMGTTWVLSPWRLPWSAPRGFRLYSTAIGWGWDDAAQRYSRWFATNTVELTVQ